MQSHEYSEPPITTAEAPTITPITAGHMLYRKCIVDDGGEPIFIKAFDDQLYTDERSQAHSKLYLEKEFAAYESLRDAGYPHIPSSVAYENNSLFLSAHLPDAGWHWEVPTDESHRTPYVDGIMAALQSLETTPFQVPDNGRPGAIEEFIADGWQALTDEATRQAISERLRSFASDFHPHVQAGTEWLLTLLQDPTIERHHNQAQQFAQLPRPHTAHFDARQSNIAWHPEQGVSVVDWSWASPAPAGCDTTMFAIDLYKSGYQLDAKHDARFNPAFAHLLMGYWLARSITPTPTDDLTVRFHQLAAAASTATLLMRQPL